MTIQLDGAFRALDQRRAFEQIIVQIEEAILAGKLRPGDRLPAERELAETFGVSRASVREALRVLERFGVVAARTGNGPNSGSIIADSASVGLTNALRLNAAVMNIPMKDTVDVRTVLEMHAVRLASRTPRPDFGDLHEAVRMMRAAKTAEDFHRHDTEFHVALAVASGNELLPVMMESLRHSIQRDMMAGYTVKGAWTSTKTRLLQQHVRILELVEAGDGERAANAVKSHIEQFYRTTANSAPDAS